MKTWWRYIICASFSFFACFFEAGADDDYALDSCFSTLFDDAWNCLGWRGYYCEVDLAGKRCDIRIGLYALNTCMFWVDGINYSTVANTDEVSEYTVAYSVFFVAGTYNSNACGTEDFVESL